MAGKVTFTDPRWAGDFIGVWVDGKPAGRIRVKDGKYVGYTNKIGPGSPGSCRGRFDTQEQAGAAVAKAFQEVK